MGRKKGSKNVKQVDETAKHESEVVKKPEIEVEKDPATAKENDGHNDLPDLPNKKLLRVYEVAQYFGVHERTIRLWIDHGKLMAEKPAGIIFISRESILKFRLLGRKVP